MPFERRIKIIQATPQVIIESSKEGIHPAVKVESWGWPSDAIVVGIREDKFTATMDVAIHSDTFDEVPEGALPPYLGHIPYLIELPKRTLVQFQCLTMTDHKFFTEGAPSIIDYWQNLTCPWCNSLVKLVTDERGYAGQTWQQLS